MTHEYYKEQLKHMVLDEQTFVRLTMKGKIRDHGHDLPSPVVLPEQAVLAAQQRWQDGLVPTSLQHVIHSHPSLLKNVILQVR